MDVSGRKLSKRFSYSKGSAEVFDLPCKPCSLNRQCVEAEGFCKNCKEYLCKTCIAHHHKFALSKNHVILDDKAYMPAIQTQTSTCNELCSKHSKETVKFYCRKHDAVGCGICMDLDHKSCEVDTIPDISEDFVSGTEYQDLTIKIKQLNDQLKAYSHSFIENANEADLAYTNCVSSIRKFRKEIDASLAKMERDLLIKCDEIKQENDAQRKKFEDKYKQHKRELDDFNTELISHSKHAGDLFVHAKRISLRLTQLASELNEACSMFKFQTCSFKRNENFEIVLSKTRSIGDVLTRMTPKKYGSVKVKQPDDKSDCFIPGIIALSIDKLVCTDYNNRSVKIVDTNSGKIVNSTTLSSEPWQVASISDGHLAVTLPNEMKIKNLTNNLSKIRSLKVKGQCRGIGYNKDKLAVSYTDPVKIEILDLQGGVHKKFQTDHSGNALFMKPLHVVVGHNNDCFYVSDAANNSVTKMTFDGHVLATYKPPDLIDPAGMTVMADGYVTISCYKSKQIHMMSPNCENVKVLLSDSDGVGDCLSLCYFARSSILYVGKHGN